MVTCILMVRNTSQDEFPVNPTSLFALPRSCLQLVYMSTLMLLKSRSTTSFSSALACKRIPTAQGSGRVMMISLSATSPFVRPVPLPFSTTWRRLRHTEYAILHISDTSNIPALAIRNRCIRAYST